MLRYVLLHHDCPPDYRDGPHWDLMLERAESTEEHRLATWSLQQLPCDWARMLQIEDAATHDQPMATQLPDHRIAYLEFEGPLAGDRGEVVRLARGELRWVQQSGDRIEALLGEPLHGVLILERQSPREWAVGWNG